MHQVERKLHPAAGVAVVAAELQERDQGANPEPPLRLEVDHLGHQVVGGGGLGVVAGGAVSSLMGRAPLGIGVDYWLRAAMFAVPAAILQGQQRF